MTINGEEDGHLGRYCLFPRLNSAPITPERQLYVSNLGVALSRQSEDLSLLFQLAWAMVLRLYTVSENVIFLYAKTDDSGVETCVCDFELTNATSLASMVNHATCGSRIQGNLWDDWRRLKDRHGTRCNTALVQNLAALESAAQSTSRFKDIGMVLQVEEVGNLEYITALDFDTSLICKEQALSLVETFRLAVNLLHAEPHAPVGDFNLCSAHDIDQLSKWNVALPYRDSVCVHDAIIEQCLRAPNRPAIDSWDGILSYCELNWMSSQFAVRLHAVGVGPGSVVPLCFEKSKFAVVALLGVLRAGGAYAFLDPSYPLSRMASMCEDMHVNVIVCSVNSSAIGAKLGLRTVTLSEKEFSSNPDRSEQQSIGSSARVNNLVYVAFTSGSTGKPKGVAIEHGAFYLRAMANRLPLSLDHRSRVLQFANYVFDISNRDILYTLIFGGCICIPSEFDRHNSLVEFMAQKQVNWASLTPSVASLLKPSDVPYLQHLVLSGESPTPLHIATWADRVNLINAYGPCETVTVSSVRNCMGAFSSHTNIGHGSGSVIWIVDQYDHNKLAPVGAVGELVIESPSIGRGYINNPTETTASFIPAPLWLQQLRSNTPPEQIYKTGDLGRYESDGSICFIGRKDAQVKIRGQRVELGEVEHHIERSLGHDTEMSIVVDDITPKGLHSPLLVAFLAPRKCTRRADGDIKATLKRILPELKKELGNRIPTYMIPSAFVPIDQIPMTTTGKKNRRQLRDICGTLTLDMLGKVQLPEGKRGPNCETGRRLQHIWASVLGMQSDSIAAGDGFFQLGGDSISAMRVAALARSEGLDLSLADILEYQKLSHLAHVVSKRPLINVAVNCRPFSLVDAESFMAKLPVELDKARSKNMIADIIPATESQVFFLTQWTLSSFRFMLHGEIDRYRLRAACRAVVSQHTSLRTVFTKLGDSFFQIVLKEIDDAFDYIRTKGNLESFCQSMLDIDLSASPLSGKPLVQFTLISSSDLEHALMVRLSHAQYDGYSSPVLFQAISAYYNNSYKTTPTFPHATPFAEYVYACNRQRTEEGFQFWRGNLQGSSMTSPAPLFSSCNDRIPVDIRQSASGNLPAPPQDLTVATLMNATLSIVLAQLAQKDDVVFGVVMNTRDIPLQGVQTMLGPCININPFRVRLLRTETLSNLCQSLHDQYAQVARHGYLDLPDIIANSTDWPQRTKLGFIINHLDGNKKPIPLSLNGALCADSSWTAKINLSHQVLVRSITTKDQLTVEILTSSGLMRAEDASALASRLVDTAQILSQSLNLVTERVGESGHA
ncbi:hypothetical protein EYZ11_004698 [Aspergillus tanneri]|uniref:Carrier domain-containing protein n=1 Tax=Aspergillus tanneri TaxID=1220188 RepID=A0A4S3JM79_9EURO|nr:hypothetical protein EYZ11_004698 [Aspergillus tanneri]